MAERIGIFGGTFDPIHNGHLVAMYAALEGAALDRVFVVPAGDPWQKSTVSASAADRLAVVHAACDGREGLEVLSLEIDRGGPTYSVDTARALRAPERELFLVLGADAVQGLDTWHEADELAALVTVVAVGRADTPTPVAPSARWRLEVVAMPRVDISSTDVRTRLATGRSVAGLVPDAAIERIAALGLYEQSGP